MARTRVYIQALVSSGVYTGTWVEVTSDVEQSGIQTIKEQLDGTAFDLGVFRPSSLSLNLDNTEGLYSDIGELYTIFGSFRRAEALVKITYDPGDYSFFAGVSRVGEIVGQETTVFQGLLNDDTAVMDLSDNQISFTVLGRESVFERIIAPYPFSNSLASTIIYECLNQSVVTGLLTLNLSNINVGTDLTIDVTSKFQNKTVKEVLSKLLKVTNSVLYIDGDSIIVKNRIATDDVQFYFYGQASTAGPENIKDIKNISNGAARVFNFVTWKDTALSSTDSTSLTRWGYRKSEIDEPSITVGATQQIVLDALRVEFGSAKREFELTTPLSINTLALSILDRVSIDYPEIITTVNAQSQYGAAIYGTSTYSTNILSFSVLPDDFYKITGRSIDMKSKLIKFKLRQV